ncbi:nucleotide sugar dehydrogenase [Nesterenkonia jeotgali]|uniref:Nucleotide sugar dehydrogenase n=1 Tax=Nesterenkonia jeotgali TaxID=317018 RepID=A0A839FFS1_9MICC|nr:nucleotide sugar dehydrogenase [Nesterenkonia jeotgali]MBA8920550.1 nucleotide sugar dehydrogenase [Nesterenkonia jeotgali]
MHSTEELDVVVVMGQGYVGLPLAEAVVESGAKVYGFEIDLNRVRSINEGHSHIDDLSDDQLRAMLTAGYEASAAPEVLCAADFAIIAVPTPLDDGGGPDLRAVESAARALAVQLKPGATVILESTTYPGTTEDVVLPILESRGRVHGRDFFLAFSPERVDPGSARFGIRNTPKLVGGLTPEATEKATRFYEGFVDTVVPLSGAKEAETAKLLENTYRHVNIALVNEMARFCHDLDIDIWEVIRGAASKPFGFQKFTPGPGVGGHCIPIDPNYLSFQVKKTLGYQFKFVELAQEINNSMPQYVVGRVSELLNEQRKPLNGSKILILGITYKPDIADQRESPALPLIEILRSRRAEVSFHDPLVEEWNVDGERLSRVPDLDAALQDADVVLLLQAHSSYDMEHVARLSETLFDTRGVASNTDGVYKL